MTTLQISKILGDLAQRRCKIHQVLPSGFKNCIYLILWLHMPLAYMQFSQFFKHKWGPEEPSSLVIFVDKLHFKKGSGFIQMKDKWT